MDKPKVAHIITDLNIGGAELMLLKTLRNFSPRYEHFAISLLREGEVGRIILKEGFRVDSLGLNMFNILRVAFSLISILKKEKPDIVHTYLFHADLLGRIAARITGVPLVISSLRNENIGGWLKERLLSMTDSCVDCVTAVSQNVADAHLAKATTRKGKMRVIYNGLEFEKMPQVVAGGDMAAPEEGRGTFTLLTVASLRKKKGHVFLFDAVSSLRRRGYKCRTLLVGDGSERKNLEREVHKKGIDDAVEFCGEKIDISGLLRRADLFILPSIWEGLPNALLEAMAAGLAVVATSVGGVPEAVIDAETGLLVDAKDSAALEAAIERLIKDERLRKRLAEGAVRYVRDRFDIKKTAKDTEALYDELMSGYTHNRKP